MMVAPSPAPTGSAAAAAVAAASSLQTQGETPPVVVAVVLVLYLIAWVAYFWMLKTSFAEEFRWGDFWEKVVVVAIEVLMGLALLIPLALIIASKFVR
jgi:hypothetical protein